jgi:23S rRNA (adenine2503-C2)-methyltransferase
MELLGKSKEELREFCVALGEPAYRGKQIYHALYAEKRFAFAQMTNLPAAFRERIAREATITLPAVRQRFASKDGSIRYLFALNTASKREEESNTENTEGAEETEKSFAKAGILRRAGGPPVAKPASVEAVWMPSAPRLDSGQAGRQTICISTQAGCAVDCRFCLTAQLGLMRNLTAGEIVGQVLVSLHESNDAGLKPGATKQAKQTNVVLMGQGEPLLNFENVMAALRIMLDPKGVGLSAKHVTLSTSGIVPGIERLAKEPVRPKLAISLNASNDEQRDALMPINRKYPLRALLEACKDYPLRNWEHLTFEYVMLGGVNDAPEDARLVVKLLARLKRVKVNLIPWNPGELPYQEPSEARLEEFRRILNQKGVPAFVRYSRGRDVMAACGQLALKEVHSSKLSVLSE